jgi:hypothetical protein
LQLREGCNLEQVTQQTLPYESRGLDGVQKQDVACSIRGVPHHALRCPEQKPTVDLMPRYFFGLHQYGQPAEDCADFGEKQWLPAYVRSGEPLALTQPVDSPLCGRLALVAESVQFGYDVLGFCAAHLTNLHERFRNRLQSSALRFREFQSNFLPFRSPVNGL